MRKLLGFTFIALIVLFAGFAVSAEEEGNTETEVVEGIQIYVCPMHLNVMSLDEEAECPECGMDLIEAPELYYCPMFCDELIFDSPDEPCPVCNMELWELEEVLICPMTCEDKVWLDYDSECDVCGMDLKVVPLKGYEHLMDNDGEAQSSGGGCCGGGGKPAEPTEPLK